MNDVGAVLPRQVDHLAHKIQVHTNRRRVVRKRNKNDLGLFFDGTIQILQAVQECCGIGHGDHMSIPFGHDDPVLVYRIGGIRGHNAVTGSDDGKHQVR